MKTIITTILLLATIMSVNAQVLEPVKWHFSSEKVDEMTYKVALTAHITKGWAIYSNETAEGGPVPTRFTFKPNQNIELIGDVIEPDDKVSGFDHLFDIMVTKIKGNATFYQLVKIKGSKEVLEGSLVFMSCDDLKCLPPTHIDFSIPIE